MRGDDPVRRFELIVSGILRGGVVASLALVLTGVVLMFAHHPHYLRSGADLERLTHPGVAFPHTLGEVVEGLKVWQGHAVVAAGLILLILTPILRVAVSILAFHVQRDRTFVLVTSLVLAILITSFLLGKAG